MDKSELVVNAFQKVMQDEIAIMTTVLTRYQLNLP